MGKIVGQSGYYKYNYRLYSLSFNRYAYKRIKIYEYINNWFYYNFLKSEIP